MSASNDCIIGIDSSDPNVTTTWIGCGIYTDGNDPDAPITLTSPDSGRTYAQDAAAGSHSDTVKETRQ